MPAVEVDGVSLYYEEKGSGPAVVFVHGIPTDYRAWAGQMAPFSQGRRAMALSRRYAFPNKREGDIMDSTVDNNAEDLRKFIEELEVAPVDLVGHSYGGFVAAYLAAANPRLVRSLVLVEPAVATLLVSNPESSASVLPLLFRSPSVALAAIRFQTGSLRPALKALDEGDLEKAVELNVDGVQGVVGAGAMLTEEARKMMLDNARTVGEQRTKFPKFNSGDAARISAPTLILNGESGTVWLRRIGEILGRSIPGAKTGKISNSRHFPHMENASEFNERVLAFLGGVSK